MSKTDAETRSDDLNNQLTKITDQCRVAFNLLHHNPYANINLNLLKIEDAIVVCRATILIYEKE